MNLRRMLNWGGLLLLLALGMAAWNRIFARPDPSVKPSLEFYSEERLPGPLPRPEELGSVLPPEPQPPPIPAAPSAEKHPDPTGNVEDPLRYLEEQGM